MLPSRPVDWVTRRPLVESVTYPVSDGFAAGDVYRPSGEGQHPAILVCLGVIPFEIDHPQVPRLGLALARSGFVALLFWSPSMRDLRLNLDDIENIALAYEWLIGQPYVDSTRSGLLGTCVGGSFAFMAAASPRIRQKVSFVTAYAPFSSTWTFLQDIASSSTVRERVREPWQVDQLTRKVFVRTLTAELEHEETELQIDSLSGREAQPDTGNAAERRRVIHTLLNQPNADEAGSALEQLTGSFRDKLSAMSPLNYVDDIQAPLIVLVHDRGDGVIPVGESRRLRDKLASHKVVHYTELQFQHLNPAKLPVCRLVGELFKFYFAIYPIFHY